MENPDQSESEFEVKEVTYEESKKMTGDLYIKLIGNLDDKPYKVTDLFYWLSDEVRWGKIDFSFKTFMVYHDVLILENNDEFLFVPYSYNGSTINDALGVREPLRLEKKYPTKVLFSEQDKAFYILQIKEWNYSTNRKLALPHIFKFVPSEYSLKEIINPFDESYKTVYEENMLDSKNYSFRDYQIYKWKLIDNGSKLRSDISSGKMENFLDFEIPQYDDNGYGELGFTYNSALGTYLITYVLTDGNGTPYLYEHKFKMTSLEVFESSLSTNIYTLKELKDGDVYWTYNANLGGGSVKNYPYVSGMRSAFISVGDIEYEDPEGVETYTYDLQKNVLDYNTTFGYLIPDEYKYSITRGIDIMNVGFEMYYDEDGFFVHPDDIPVVEPEVPETPEEPDVPVEPDEPEQPEEPDTPDTPVEPDEPEEIVPVEPSSKEIYITSSDTITDNNVSCIYEAEYYQPEG